jgi:carbonic anhydrase/acetyltransferase-like protein (isoleucine patch superfamily)
LIGAHSSVKGKTEKHSIYVGSPAKNVGPTSRIKLEDGTDAYPWTKHFKRGYPEDVIKNW